MMELIAEDCIRTIKYTKKPFLGQASLSKQYRKPSLYCIVRLMKYVTASQQNLLLVSVYVLNKCNLLS